MPSHHRAISLGAISLGAIALGAIALGAIALGAIALSAISLSAIAVSAILALTACSPARGDDAREPARIELRGRWLLDADGDAVGPDDFRRGLQSSGLTRVRGELWSVGDQRSAYPGHLLRIDRDSARLKGAPIRFRLAARDGAESAHFTAYRALPNADFEGICADPKAPNRLFAVTEDKTPWIATLAVRSKGDALDISIEHLAEVDISALAPWRDDSNFRLEGIACDGERLLLVYERASDDLPRLLEVPIAEASSRDEVRPAAIDIDFAAIERRTDKAPARLNLNGIDVFRRGDRRLLAAVARDQERVIFIDLDAKKVVRVVDFDLRDPEGRAILWVSPEGLAVDAERGELWLVNDPDSVRGNYRLLAGEAATGRFAEYAPLLFRAELAAILGEAP